MLPDKSMFEKVIGHASDFIKERMRKMKHFMTLVTSHAKLKNSEHFRSFLCENDKVFRATLKSYDVDNQNCTSPTKNKTTWMSLASSSFGKVFNKAKEWEFDKIIPGVKKLLSTPDEEISGHDLLVMKIEDKLEILKASIVEFYRLVTSTYECRSKQYSLEKKSGLMTKECQVFSDLDIQAMVNTYGTDCEAHSERIHDNVTQLKEIIYATESHLVWIDSVFDLINRKHEVGGQITEIKNQMKKNDLTHDNVGTCKRLLSLTERREAMIKGVIREMDKLCIGTKDFYTRFVNNGYIQVAYGVS